MSSVGCAAPLWRGAGEPSPVGARTTGVFRGERDHTAQIARNTARFDSEPSRPWGDLRLNIKTWPGGRGPLCAELLKLPRGEAARSAPGPGPRRPGPPGRGVPPLQGHALRGGLPLARAGPAPGPRARPPPRPATRVVSAVSGVCPVVRRARCRCAGWGLGVGGGAPVRRAWRRRASVRQASSEVRLRAPPARAPAGPRAPAAQPAAGAGLARPSPLAPASGLRALRTPACGERRPRPRVRAPAPRGRRPRSQVPSAAPGPHGPGVRPSAGRARPSPAPGRGAGIAFLNRTLDSPCILYMFYYILISCNVQNPKSLRLRFK